MLQKGFGQIDFSKGNKEVHDFIRALDPAPAAYAILNGDKIKIFASKIAEAAARNKPGTILTANAKEGLFVATGDGAVEITELQWPGSRRMKAKDFLSHPGPLVLRTAPLKYPPPAPDTCGNTSFTSIS